MDYSTIYGRVQDTVDDDSSTTLTIIKNYINDTYREVLEFADEWEFLKKSYSENLVADQRLYTLQTDVRKLNRVQIKLNATAEYKNIPLISHERYMNIEDESTTTTSLPRYAHKEMNDGTESLGFFPIMSYATTNGLRYWYQKTVSDLSADSDTPVFPSNYHEILVFGAAFRWFDEEDDLRAPRFERLYRNMLLRMQSNLARNQGEEDEPVAFANG